MAPLNLKALLKAMLEKGASDLHVTAGSPPRTGSWRVCHPVVISNAGRSARRADLPMSHHALGAAEHRL